MSLMQYPDKKSVLDRCVETVLEKVTTLEKQLSELAESVSNETKSTAGDKYETARAMLHIEQDQVRRQLLELKAQLAVLQSIDPGQRAGAAALGSLVNLDGSWYFVSTGLGRVRCGDHIVIALSLQSPLGAKLRGKQTGDIVAINGSERVVRTVL